jgi:hypothetical protein
MYIHTHTHITTTKHVTYMHTNTHTHTQAGIALYALHGHELLHRQNIEVTGAISTSILPSMDGSLYIGIAHANGISVRRWVESSFRSDPAVTNSLDIVWVPGQFLERVQDMQMNNVRGCSLFVSAGAMYLAVVQYSNDEGTSRAPVAIYR